MRAPAVGSWTLRNGVRGVWPLSTGGTAAELLPPDHRTLLPPSCAWRLWAPRGLQSEDQINPVVSRAKRGTWKRAGSATSVNTVASAGWR